MTFEDVLMCDKQNKKTYEELKSQCKKEKIIPFIGAGLSIPPYRGWRDTLEEMLSDCDDITKDTLIDLLDASEYEKAADYIYETLGKGQFEKSFKSFFSYDKIRNLGISNSMGLVPLVFSNAVITTNFDKCIENAYEKEGNPFSSIITPKEVADLSNYLTQITRSNMHFLWKIHGDIDCFNKRVFTSKEYDATYAPNTGSMVAVENFFRTNCLLFLGCSLNGSDRYMKLLEKIGANADITNYAIVQKPADREKFASYKKMLSDHWIFPIWYPAEDVDHESVSIILRNLNADMYDDSVREIDSNYSKYSIPAYVEEVFKKKGISIDIPREENLTVDDVVAIIQGKTAAYSYLGLVDEINSSLGEIYDIKYKNSKIEKDTRGLDNEWVEKFNKILKGLKVSDLSNKKTLVVGIGNGEEGDRLGFNKVLDGNLILADIATNSLKKSQKKYVKAECINQCAQDLSRIKSASIDLYISLRTYQSTFFNIDKALYEALRILKRNGKIIISISNGFISTNDGSYIPGLINADGKTIDRNKPKVITAYICNKMKKLMFKKVNSIETKSEIYIYAVKG